MYNDTNPGEYTKKKDTEGILWSVLASFGYEEAGIPAEEIKMSKSVASATEKRFSSGRYSCCNTAEENSKYAYVLFGAKTAAAYAEPIAVAIEALIACEIDDFYVNIGSNTFVKALCEKAGDKDGKMFAAIASEDEDELERILSENGENEWNDVILNIRDITSEAFDEKADELPEAAASALDTLTEIYGMTVLYGLEKFPVLDPGSATDGACTDMHFEVYSGDDELVCSGGISENGNAFAELDLNKLAKLRPQAEKKASKTVIYPEENSCGIAYELAYNLRISGCIAEGWVGSGNFEEAEEYSKRTNAGSMIRVFPDGKLLIKDFADGSVTETNVEDFLEYYEDEDECDCGRGGECDCGEHHHCEDGHDCDCHR